MNDDTVAVTGGVDCHQRTHHAAALDATGRLLADAESPANLAGYQALLAWLQTSGRSPPWALSPPARTAPG